MERRSLPSLLSRNDRFNSLQTGRSMESATTLAAFCQCVRCFNFPSNGKEHGKLKELEREISKAILFQFPSNGKEHGKGSDGTCLHPSKLSKFQFPSNGKEHGKLNPENLKDVIGVKSFNSLQTGRSMESFLRINTNKLRANSSFNSLQTGRSMERKSGKEVSRKEVTYVSIPFKREGAWKVTEENKWKKERYKFVSIPFKREGAWKVKSWRNFKSEKKFQFPSNGKEHGKRLD